MFLGWKEYKYGKRTVGNDVGRIMEVVSYNSKKVLY